MSSQWIKVRQAVKKKSLRIPPIQTVHSGKGGENMKAKERPECFKAERRLHSL